MSVLHSEDALREWSYSGASGLPCFVCHGELTFPAGYWHGQFDMVLHEECAHGLFRGMGRDLDEIIAMRERWAVL